ncbi:MAG: sulfotransferase domain-containing protein [Alphaproteobacteria bacterium]|nr:sulfotransferase domain-containing protein [Alphaproteobacteria bacterium]
MFDVSRMPLKTRLILRVPWLLGVLGLGRLAVEGLIRLSPKASRRAGQRAFEGYVPDEHDLIVASFPKSGTNWTLQLTAQLLGGGEVDFEHIHDVVPWPDGPVSLDAALHRRPTTGMRAIKTHLPAEDIPLDDRARYIVVMRDPKDVYVSAYHFFGGVARGIIGTFLTPEAWYKRFLAAKGPMNNWADFAAGWWALRDRENVMILTYAQLKADPAAALERIAAFTDTPLSPELKASVLERSGFAWMKAHEDRFMPVLPHWRGAPGTMLRAGKRGGAREMLDDAQRAQIDATMRARLLELGSDLPYDALFGERATDSSSSRKMLA